MSVSQDVFNQYRESKIIEIIQALARSDIGRLLAFKGGTALRLFWGLSRFSQDMDYTLLKQSKRDTVYKAVHALAEELGYEITDAARKYKTILFEFRFRWEGPTFHLKVEISHPLPEDPGGANIPVRVASLRGVPVLVLQEGRLTAQKLCAFLQRETPRDAYDLWFILNKRLKVDWDYMRHRKTANSERDFFAKALRRVEDFSKRRLAEEIGKLVSVQEREWLKKNFLADLQELIRNRMGRH